VVHNFFNFFIFFKLLLIIFFQIFIVITETPIFSLSDANDHGIDGKVGNAGASLSD